MNAGRVIAALALLGSLARCTKKCEPMAVPGRIDVGLEARGETSTYVAVGDCSGDGRPDLINADRVFVARADGGFDMQNLGVLLSATAGTLVDLDADGERDLVVAGSDVEWFHGLGACRFAMGVRLAAPTEGIADQVLATDIDLDGLTDLAISYTARRESPIVLLTALGDGRFVDRSPPFAPRDPPYQGYGTFFDDVDGDGYRDLFVIADFDEGWFGWARPADEPAYVRDAPVSDSFADAHPMSLCPLDSDRDGRIDYFVSGVTNGNLLLRGTGGRSLASVADSAGMFSPPDAYAWGCAALDADLDGWSDVMVLSLASENGGAAPATLYLNQKNGTYGCASPGVLDATIQAHSLACADFSLDGQPECLVTDGAARGFVTLRDQLTPRGHWVGVRLRGTVSSTEASGARVSLDGESPPLVVLAGGQSPIGGEHDRAAVLAIGARDRADVTIAWPSGLRQTLRGLPAGQYTDVVEPRALTVTPRVTAADGASTAEVVVDVAAAGARAATIECSGACAWTGASTLDDVGRLHRTLRAPSVAGSARIVVSLDGVALRVRPRVRFVAP